MTPLKGSFPFCNVPLMTSAQQIQGLYPVPFTWSQITDAYLNVKNYSFTINAVQDLTDASLEITQAMSVLNATGIAGLGIAVEPILSSAANRTSVTGLTRREWDGSCMGYRHIYNQNLCLVVIDFGKTVRRQLGRTQTVNAFLYYPKITVLFYASGYVFANDVTLLQGAGTMIGGIDLIGSQGVITSLNVVGSEGPPIGEPSVFGQLTPQERYDKMIIKRTSGSLVSFHDGKTYTTLLHLSGMSFDDVLGIENVGFGGVWFGSVPCPIHSGTFGTPALTLGVPDNAPRNEPITFVPYFGAAGNNDRYTTRLPLGAYL